VRHCAYEDNLATKPTPVAVDDDYCAPRKMLANDSTSADDARVRMGRLIDTDPGGA
jgi:hypothetical protein